MLKTTTQSAVVEKPPGPGKVVRLTISLYEEQYQMVQTMCQQLQINTSLAYRLMTAVCYRDGLIVKEYLKRLKESLRTG